MGFYDRLLTHLCEHDAAALARLPAGFLAARARELLAADAIYLLEQLGKHHDVGAALDRPQVVQRMAAALDDGRVDDFLYLRGLAGGEPVDRARLEAAYAALACRGNVAGIEAIVQRTQVAARLDEPTARRAYDVLAAMGRVGAIDYVRQLSGIAPAFSPAAVQTGYRALLRSGRFAALHDLRQLSGVAPALAADDVAPAIERAIADLDFAGLASIAPIVGWPAHAFTGFARLLAGVVAERRFRQIAPLFALAADADAGLLDEPILTAMLAIGDPASIELIYGRPELAAFQRAHADAAYRIAVASRGRAAVAAVCARGGVALRREDLAPLLEDALAAGDVVWIAATGAQVGALPAVDPAIAQAFLFELRRTADPRAAAMERTLAITYDPALAAWGDAIQRGALAAARAMRVAGDPAPAIQRALGEPSGG